MIIAIIGLIIILYIIFVNKGKVFDRFYTKQRIIFRLKFGLILSILGAVIATVAIKIESKNEPEYIYKFESPFGDERILCAMRYSLIPDLKEEIFRRQMRGDYSEFEKTYYGGARNINFAGPYLGQDLKLIFCDQFYAVRILDTVETDIIKFHALYNDSTDTKFSGYVHMDCIVKKKD